MGTLKGREGDTEKGKETETPRRQERGAGA